MKELINKVINENSDSLFNVIGNIIIEVINQKYDEDVISQKYSEKELEEKYDKIYSEVSSEVYKAVSAFIK